MKTNKFNFDWKGVLFGMALCLALVVFVGSMAQGNQVGNQTGIRIQKDKAETQQGLNQKMVTMNDVMAKCELIDQRILIVEGKINKLQTDMNAVLDSLTTLLNRGK
jgi:hypothetical protein